MGRLSDWELFKQQLATDFPYEALKESCGNCEHSTWAKSGNANSLVPYCSKLKFTLRTLDESDSCSFYESSNK